MKKAILVIIILISIAIYYNYNIVIVGSTYTPHELKINKGDTIQPLKKFDFNKGKWSAYISISRNDFAELDENITKANCLKSDDRDLFKLMQKEWKFIYQEADIATVESAFYLFKDGELMFESGIILDENSEGLQSREFGWVVPINNKAITKICSKFHRVYLPIIIL